MPATTPNPGPYTLDPFQSDVVTLKWGAGAGGSFTGTITVNNAPGSPEPRGWLLNPTSCAVSTPTAPPAAPVWRFGIVFAPNTVIPAGVTAAQFMAGTFVGALSGFSWVPTSSTPDYRCGDWKGPVADRWTGGTGQTVPGQPATSLQYPFFTNLDFDTGSGNAVIACYATGGAWPWIVGETVNATV